MYKHMSTSIKETENKQFVSIQDKEKWDNKCDNDHTHDDIYYTKSEMNEKIEEKFLPCEGNVIHTESVDGFTKNLEIFGNTEHEERIILHNRVAVTSGAIGVNGNETEDSNSNRTNFFSIQNGDTILFMNGSIHRATTAVFYDSAKNIIGGHERIQESFNVNIPNVNFVRFYQHVENTDSIRIIIKRKDIANVLSVGNKREDGLYDISVKSVGRNLFDINRAYEHLKDIKDGVFIQDNSLLFDCSTVAVGNAIRDRVEGIYPDFKFKEKTSYKLTCKVEHVGGLRIVAAFLYTDGTLGTVASQDNFEIISDSQKTVKAITVNWSTQLNPATSKWTDIVLEELNSNNGLKGYEPYQNYDLDITLPFPLDKVGDVEDRLYVREDGIVCVDKHIGAYKFTGEEPWIEDPGFANGKYEEMDNCIRVWLHHNTNIIPNVKINTKEQIISNRFNSASDVNRSSSYTRDVENIFNGKAAISNTILKSKLRSDLDKISAFKVWLKENDYILKYQYNTPETIEIGHIDNLRLKTFDKSTTIFTATGNGRIKCDVPANLSSSINSTNNAIKDIENIIEDMNSLVEKSNCINIDEPGDVVISSTIPGFTSDIKLRGKTLVNRAPLHSEWNVEGGGSYSHTNNAIFLKPNGRKTKLYKYLNLHPNTNYDFYSCLNNSNTTTVAKVFIIDGHSTNTDNHNEVYQVAPSTNKNGKNHYVFRTNSEGYVTIIFESETSTGQLHIESIMITEKDIKNKKARLFSGLVNIDSEIEFVSYDLNNIFVNTFSDGFISETGGNVDTSAGSLRSSLHTTHFIPVQPNISKLYYGFQTPYTTFEASIVFCYDENKRYIGLVRTSSRNTSKLDEVVTLIPGTKYIKFRIHNFVDVTKKIVKNCYVSQKGPGYKHPNFYKQKITLSEPLRSLPNGVCDTIEKVNGKYCVIRRCGEIILNGQEGHGTLLQVGNSYRFTVTIGNNTKPSSVIYCDKLQHSVANNIAGKYISIDTKGVGIIALPSEELDGNSLESIRSWLINNNLKVVYELKSYIIESLDIDPNVRLFEGDTAIDIRTDGPLVPEISLYIPQNLNNVVHSIMDKIQTLEESDIYTNRLQLNSTYQADKASYSFAISTFEDSYNSQEYNEELFELFLSVILTGKENYNRDIIEEQIDFYTITSKFSYEMADILFNIIEEQNTDFSHEIEC